MPIILPEPYELSDREHEIWLVMSSIESALTDARPVALYALAENILDEIDNARASADGEAEWLASLPAEPDEERLSAAEEARLDAARRAYLAQRKAAASKLPKPRIRVRAATARAA